MCHLFYSFMTSEMQWNILRPISSEGASVPRSKAARRCASIPLISESLLRLRQAPTRRCCICCANPFCAVDIVCCVMLRTCCWPASVEYDVFGFVRSLLLCGVHASSTLHVWRTSTYMCHKKDLGCVTLCGKKNRRKHRKSTTECILESSLQDHLPCLQ